MPSAVLLFAFLLSLAAANEDDWGGAPSPSAAAPASSHPAEELQPSVARQIQLLKLRANGFYRARKFREACDLYSAAARLDARDASVRNDIGLCYRKLGFKDSALAATRAALEIADPSLARADTAAWSFADLRARKTAYFNLDKLGGPMTAPAPGKCEAWAPASVTPAAAACEARLHVCVEQGSRPAAGGTLRWNILRASVVKAAALFTYDEVEVPSQVPHPGMRDMEELSIDGVPESKLRWINRDTAVTLPLGEFVVTADSVCKPKPLCGDLERERTQCRVVHFDPCAGVVGVVCGIEEEGGEDRIQVGEFYLDPMR